MLCIFLTLCFNCFTLVQAANAVMLTTASQPQQQQQQQVLPTIAGAAPAFSGDLKSLPSSELGSQVAPVVKQENTAVLQDQVQHLAVQVIVNWLQLSSTSFQVELLDMMSRFVNIPGFATCSGKESSRESGTAIGPAG